MHEDGARLLARAVIARALSDVGIGSDDGVRRSITSLDRAQSAAFLTADGNWERSRRAWCDLADLDPDILSRRVRKALADFSAPAATPAEPASLPEPPKREPRVGTKVRALWDLLETPEGVEPEHAAAMLSWKRASVLTCITGDLPQKYGVRCTRGDDGRYRFIQAAA